MRTHLLPSATFIGAIVFATTLTVGCVAPGANAQGTPPEATGVWGDFLAGHHAEATGDSRAALEFYAAATRNGLPAKADLYSRIYVLGLTEGRIDGALEALDKTEQLGGKAPLARLTRAVRALRDGDFNAADDLLAGDDGGVTRILGPVLRAWARVGRKDFPGALAALNSTTGDAENKDPKPTPLHLLHSALINDLAGNAKVAGKKFDQLRKSSGLSVRTAELNGQHLERRDRPRDARKVYQSLGPDAEGLILIENLEMRLKAKTRPALDVDSAQKGAAEALYGVASALLAQNAWESAIALSHLASTLRPDFPPAAMVAATALQRNDRRAEANAIYAAMPPRSPFSWMARLHMADNLDRMGQTKKALKLLDAMSRERATLSRPLIERGDVLRRHERFKEAAATYTRALARIAKPNDAHWSVFYSRGISYERNKQWPKAEADFLRALELRPEQPAVLNYLGYSWIDQKMHMERALAMIAKAVEQRPRDGSIVDSLGWGLYRTGDFKGAVKNLERAVMLRPGDPIINDHLGDALWQVGRVREARFQWERALVLKPDADLIALIEKKLKSGLAAAKP